MSEHSPTQEEQELGEFCELITKGTTPQAYLTKGINFIKVESVSSDGKLIESKFAKISEGENANLKRSQLRSGDILFSIAGTLGRVAAVEDRHLPANTNQALAIARLKNDALDRQYCLHYLTSEKVQLHLKKLQTIGAQPNLSLQQVSQIPILVPPLAEQKKIAEILSGIDRHIMSVQKKSEKNNLLAECLLEDLIGALLYENGSNTEVRRIQEIATIKGGKRMPKGEPFADAPTPYPYLRVSDMKDMSIDSRNLKYATEKAQRQIKNYTISSNDVYITIAGSIGVVGMIPCALNGALLTENAAKISVTSEHILPRYLMYCLASSAVQRQFREETGTGGGVPKLALFRIGNSSIPICNIETQQRIVKSMDGIAEEARMLSSKQNLLASIRNGISFDLLSGRKRVSV